MKRKLTHPLSPDEALLRAWPDTWAAARSCDFLPQEKSWKLEHCAPAHIDALS